MTVPAGLHYDGDYTAPVQITPWEPIVDNVTQSTGFKATFQQIAADFVRLDFTDTAGPSSTHLVAESEPRYIGAELVEWDRTYWPVPGDRSEYETFTANYQTTVTTGGTTTLGQIGLMVTSRVDYTYYYIPNTDYATPADVPKFEVYKLIQLAPNTFAYVGTDPGGADPIVGENSGIKRWKGNIYERKVRYIPKFSFTDL